MIYRVNGANGTTGSSIEILPWERGQKVNHDLQADLIADVLWAWLPWSTVQLIPGKIADRIKPPDESDS
jgi:hypothetical protein